jgi:PAS domain S-box-containing protein
MQTDKFLRGKILLVLYLSLSFFMILAAARIYVMSELTAHRAEFLTIIFLLIFLPGLVLVLVWRRQERRLLLQQIEAANSLKESFARYKDLFLSNPIPMWVYRVSDLKFLEVNDAAVEKYGYSRDEFTSMNLTQIRPPSEIGRLSEELIKPRADYHHIPGIWNHQLRDGRIIKVEINSHRLEYNGEKASLAMAYDVTERESEVKDLWDNAPCGYHTLSPDLTILHMNATELQWLGYTAEEVVGKLKIGDLMTAEGKSLLAKGFDYLVEKGGIKDIENEFIRKDGSLLAVMLSAKVIRNDDGSLSHIRATAVDDTLLRAVRHEKDEKFRMLAENSFDEIFMFDMSLKYTYVSPVVLQLRGLTVKEAMEETLAEGMTPASAEIAHRLIGQQMQQINADPFSRPEPITVDLEMLRKDGSTVWTEVKCGFIYGMDGMPVGALGITRDISERKRMIEELIVAKERAEQSELLKSAFLANMSHEIRTPLNAIIGFSDLLVEEEDPLEKQVYIQAINSGADQLLQIIDDVMYISRIDTGEVAIRLADQSLSTVFSELEVQLRKIILNKCPEGHTLGVFVEKGRNQDLVCMDKEKFSKIMNTLFDNGVKFTSEGKITFGYGPGCGKNLVRFFVRDTGIGIQEDQQALIFERFRQADHALSRRFGGTGLGLAISKSLVEMMGGTLGVISQVGKGSEFWFELPLHSNLN